MAKRIEIDGKFYRMRRGTLVEIPSEWVGNTTHPQTIRKRQSKQTGKSRRKGNWGSKYRERLPSRMEENKGPIEEGLE